MEPQSKSASLITYIHEISGQLRKQSIIESEHAYNKFWNRHPDLSNKSRPARFLFMQSFSKWNPTDRDPDVIDVDGDPAISSIAPHAAANNPLVAEVTALTKGQVTITEEFAVTDSVPNKSAWSTLAQRIWAKALNILYSDRLMRLAIEGTSNEIITKKMISSKCANKFRHLFASLAFWDPSILAWLHATLMEHVSGVYLTAYHESMSILKSKYPALVDRFYLPPAHDSSLRLRVKGATMDPIQAVLSTLKPKRIKNCPLFILVPNGPAPPSAGMTLSRQKNWHNLFSSLGKTISLSVNYSPTMRVKECLTEIMSCVRDKIQECRTTCTEGRPIILVGFGHSSLIAAQVALEPSSKVTAIVCLGFPLAGVNGFRGDLDDPFLDLSVPALFVIGQNATLSSIDDIEDFRERISKTETGLVVVGGANDHLIVSQTKQKFTGITQAVVDRCISDEIYDFVNFVMNPYFVPSEKNYISLAAKASLAAKQDGIEKPREKKGRPKGAKNIKKSDKMLKKLESKKAAKENSKSAGDAGSGAPSIVTRKHEAPVDALRGVDAATKKCELFKVLTGGEPLPKFSDPSKSSSESGKTSSSASVGPFSSNTTSTTTSTTTTTTTTTKATITETAATIATKGKRTKTRRSKGLKNGEGKKGSAGSKLSPFSASRKATAGSSSTDCVDVTGVAVTPTAKTTTAATKTEGDKVKRKAVETTETIAGSAKPSNGETKMVAAGGLVIRETPKAAKETPAVSGISGPATTPKVTSKKGSILVSGTQGSGTKKALKRLKGDISGTPKPKKKSKTSPGPAKTSTPTTTDSPMPGKAGS